MAKRSIGSRQIGVSTAERPAEPSIVSGASRASSASRAASCAELRQRAEQSAKQYIGSKPSSKLNGESSASRAASQASIGSEPRGASSAECELSGGSSENRATSRTEYRQRAEQTDKWNIGSGPSGVSSVKRRAEWSIVSELSTGWASGGLAVGQVEHCPQSSDPSGALSASRVASDISICHQNQSAIAASSCQPAERNIVLEPDGEPSAASSVS
jgi:hypothetical protein